ncbi:hypothetical protein FPQ18DRAFT_413303 [Pyronema domesticum]|nr:hypothetical protein FPQ18DRAFT_413303 [Pyronema domesticum]
MQRPFENIYIDRDAQDNVETAWADFRRRVARDPNDRDKAWADFQHRVARDLPVIEVDDRYVELWGDLGGQTDFGRFRLVGFGRPRQPLSEQPLPPPGIHDDPFQQRGTFDDQGEANFGERERDYRPRGPDYGEQRGGYDEWQGNYGRPEGNYGQLDGNHDQQGRNYGEQDGNYGLGPQPREPFGFGRPAGAPSQLPPSRDRPADGYHGGGPQGGYPYDVPGGYPYDVPGGYPYDGPDGYPYDGPGGYPYDGPGGYPYDEPGGYDDGWY